MIFRHLRFALRLNSHGASTFLADRSRRLLSKAGIFLLTLFLTFCTPNPSGFEKTEVIPVTPIASSPTSVAPTPSPVITSTPVNAVPVLAYYYIWFDIQSWNRAKTDYPLLGRYSSDDAVVMRQHIRWAKEAGISGFIVSWKGTDKLNRRLDQLVEIAEQEDFKLAIIYESLNFERKPLPVEQVSDDLSYFIDRYADHQVFDLLGKPMVIWAGTWEFSLEEIQMVVQDKREHIFILASEKNVKGYQRVANLVDGDAYYWSSVNPETHPGYPEKLKAMGEAVHAHDGLWVAPAAPGFDSRLLGGTTAIDRKAGKTLQTEIEAALQSIPDAIGLISWNEFSENTHIEPSENHDDQYLEVLAEMDIIISNPK
ncbi:MAG TPA: endo-1,3-alpha-glucanase family glycosylhydrolase [Anaerolineales bacterium]|nr:endo-1,3-alpha-glucanase family glycosylhydrolase [Anaerolineales bacterium]